MKGPMLICFYTSARLRRRRTQPFGYYTNIVQQIELIIHTNFQPLPGIFFSLKVKVIGQRLKTILLTR